MERLWRSEWHGGQNAVEREGACQNPAMDIRTSMDHRLKKVAWHSFNSITKIYDYKMISQAAQTLVCLQS